jgi:hypothetical protein
MYIYTYKGIGASATAELKESSCNIQTVRSYHAMVWGKCKCITLRRGEKEKR